MAVRTKRLAVGVTASPAGSKTIYTCPAGRTAIVKDLRVSAVVAGPVTGILFVTSGPSPSVNLLQLPSLTGGQTSGSSVYLVLGPGDQLGLTSTVAAGLAYYVSGVELDGVAP